MLLLDTRLVLWFAFEPDRLPAKARRLLQDRGNELAFSVATLWEVAIKTSLGREDFKVDSLRLRNGLLAEGVAELRIEAEHVGARGRPAVSSSRSLRSPVGGTGPSGARDLADGRPDPGRLRAQRARGVSG